jgi:phospholipid transport system substrate-binding protein
MLIRGLVRPLAILAASLALLAGPLGGLARAAETDPAITTIDAFDKALIETMKAGGDLGVKGRYRKLEPVIERTFNLPVMTRFAVGTRWTEFSDAEHQGLIDAFTRLTVASYAHNFAAYDGERFDIDPNVQTRDPDKIVKTRLIPRKDAPVVLDYRMRQAGGSWKVIDIFYGGGISQLTIRRSDLAATAATGGAAALTKSLNGQADKLMK